MTLFTLAKRNVSRNFSQYFLYMFSMVVSIAIYFTFVALKYSDSVAQKMTTSTKVSALMGGASVILLIFVAIFIFYSNSFFLKKRKKEVALYALLGLRKRQIGKMLFFENLLIGLIALIIGTALGFLFSKGFAMLLLIFIHSSETVSFTFSLTAVLQTALVFFLLFFITSLQGYRLIYRFKLIDLFHAEGKGESMPKPSLWLALIAILSIAAGYYLALENILTSKWWELFGMLTTPLLILVLVIAGTFLLFHSLVGYFFIYMKKTPALLWKNLRLITISQLAYRIRANARILTIIAVLSATTITAGGAIFGIYYNTTSSVKKADPNTLMFTANAALNKHADAILKHPTYDMIIPVVEAKFEAKSINQNAENERILPVMAVSNYNQLAGKQHKPRLQLTKNNGLMLDSAYDKRFSPDYTNKTITSKNQTIKLQGFRTKTVLNAISGSNAVIVSDTAFKEFQAKHQTTFIRLIQDPLLKADDTKKLHSFITAKTLFSSQPEDIQSSFEGIGVMLFIGSFLGIVFLIAMGSIIYFKVLTEAEADKEQYLMLFKLGNNIQALRKTIAAQIAAFFVIPLIIGLAHSAIALKAFSALLGVQLFLPIMLWMIAFTVIYILYYFATVHAYMKVIKQTIRTEAI